MNSNEKIIHWIDTILHEVSNLDDDRGIDILHACGAECSKTSAYLEGAEKIRNENKGKSPDAIFKAFMVRYDVSQMLKKDGDVITLIFEECTCPMVKEGVNNSFLCNCTTGYTIKVFEALFGRPVTVRLEESILRGGKICRQIITLKD